MNIELEMKADGQMEDSVLAKAIIIENHRKLRVCEKETFKKLTNNVKTTGSHIMPRLQEPSNENLGTTKNKMPAIEECSDVKARPSIKLNDV